MKKYFVLVSLMVASAFASASDYPATLVCEGAEPTSSLLNSFEITGLDTETPDSSIADSSFFQKTLVGETLGLAFSNECDNMYEVSFNVNDLSQAKAGQIRQVFARVQYSNSDVPNGETIEAVCEVR